MHYIYTRYFGFPKGLIQLQNKKIAVFKIQLSNYIVTIYCDKLNKLIYFNKNLMFSKKHNIKINIIGSRYTILCYLPRYVYRSKIALLLQTEWETYVCAYVTKNNYLH